MYLPVCYNSLQSLGRRPSTWVQTLELLRRDQVTQPESINSTTFPFHSSATTRPSDTGTRGSSVECNCTSSRHGSNVAVTCRMMQPDAHVFSTSVCWIKASTPRHHGAKPVKASTMCETPTRHFDVGLSSMARPLWAHEACPADLCSPLVSKCFHGHLSSKDAMV